MFLEKSWRYANGYINIKVEGYFIERFLNMCMNRKIELWNIKKLNEAELLVNIKYNEYSMVKEIAEITKCKLSIKKKKGVPDLVNRYKKRKIFICIFALSLMGIWIYSSRIWQLEITGEFNIPIEELWNELEVEGVRIGMRKKDLDYTKIKSNIYLRRNDVAWMGFEINGTKAYVEFVQRVNKEEDKLENTPCNIVSNKEGIVQKVLVKSGQKAVNTGDFVSKGQILISGIVSNSDDKSRHVHADGEVTLKTSYVNKVTVPFEKDLAYKTGKKEKKYKLEIGNYQINFINNDTKFEKYDTITVSNQLRVFKRFEVPIRLTKLTYEELKIDTVKYTKEQAETIAKNEAMLNIERQISKIKDSIISKNVNISESENSVSATVIVQCVEKVGVKEKIGD